MIKAAKCLVPEEGLRKKSLPILSFIFKRQLVKAHEHRRLPINQVSIEPTKQSLSLPVGFVCIDRYVHLNRNRAQFAGLG
jgi:hypothetical protein